MNIWEIIKGFTARRIGKIYWEKRRVTMNEHIRHLKAEREVGREWNPYCPGCNPDGLLITGEFYNG